MYTHYNKIRLGRQKRAVLTGNDAPLTGDFSLRIVFFAQAVYN